MTTLSHLSLPWKLMEATKISENTVEGAERNTFVAFGKGHVHSFPIFSPFAKPTIFFLVFITTDVIVRSIFLN